MFHVVDEFASRARMVMQAKTQGLYWFGPNIPTSSSSALVFLHWFVVESDKQTREGMRLSSLYVACVCLKSRPLRGTRLMVGYMKKKENESIKDLRVKCLPTLLPPAPGLGGSVWWRRSVFSPTPGTRAAVTIRGGDGMLLVTWLLARYGRLDVSCVTAVVGIL